jgi:putative membrane protein
LDLAREAGSDPRDVLQTVLARGAAARADSDTTSSRQEVYMSNRSTRDVPGRRYVAGLAALFAVIWLLLAIRPRHRADWALENALVVLAVLVLALAHRRLALSHLSYTLIFVFLCFHVIGAHYTYSEVPYDAWATALTGRSLNAALGWQRNNFDRIAHFIYGLLLTYPVREVVIRVTGLRGFWGYFLPMDLTISSSASYELIEWGAAVVFGGSQGLRYCIASSIRLRTI